VTALRSLALLAAAAAALQAAPAASAAPGQPDPPPPRAVTVPESSVLEAPYTLRVAPGGEIRIITFPDSLVSAAVVARPWLLTVIIQGHDAIVQARASSGETQLVVYAGGSGTLWRVVIAPHPPLPDRVIVARDEDAAALRAPAPRQAPPSAEAPRAPSGRGAGAASPPGAEAPAPRTLDAFAASLSPAQRLALDAWRASPTADNLSRFLALLSPAQKAAFDRLVRSGAVPVPGPAAAPRVVETDTVIQPASPPGSPRAVVTRAPAWVSASATARPDGGDIIIDVFLSNRSATPAVVSSVSARTASGETVTPIVSGRQDVPAAGSASLAIRVPASSAPLTLDLALSAGGPRQPDIVSIDVAPPGGAP
jgi:hypothetical protein